MWGCIIVDLKLRKRTAHTWRHSLGCGRTRFVLCASSQSPIMAILARLIKWTAQGILTLIVVIGCLILCAWVTRPPVGNSYLWRINGSQPSYLYGTIHIPRHLIWPSVPQSTKDALKVSFQIPVKCSQNCWWRIALPLAASGVAFNRQLHAT